MPKSKAYSNPLPSLADEQRYGTKCLELRAKIREIERENQNIQLKILQSKKNVSRLRIERSVLYEALATITANAAKAADLTLPPQAQPSTSNPPLPFPNSNPTPPITSAHNGYHPQNIPPPNRAYNEATATSNNHGQVPNRSFNRSTEPLPINGITGLLNSSNNNSHHGPPPPIPHSQYPQNLPIQVQAPPHNPRMSANTHQLAPMSSDPTANTRFSSASNSPTAPNSHFPHHQLGARSMSVSTQHHHHSRFPSPHHHHHHHHHHRHPSEHAHANPAAATALPSLRPHPHASQPLSNGNGNGPVPRAQEEGAEEEEEEAGDEDGEEDEEDDEGEGSAKDGSTSMRQVDDEMEIDAECEEEE